MEKFLLVNRLCAQVAAEISFERLRAELTGLLPRGTEIAHVGATAIPGCDTKGDLDIVVRVMPAHFQHARRVLAGRFEENIGSESTDDFAAFKDDRAHPPLGVQLVIRDAPLDFFVAFRDLLRTDPDLLAEYNLLKRRFVGRSMDDYRTAKSEFIESVLRGQPAPKESNRGNGR